MHRLDSAVFKQIIKYQPSNVYAIGWRRVEHRAVVSMCLIVEHRDNILIFSDEVFPYDDNCHACGADIFLRARIDNAEFGNVYLLREDAGTHISSDI